MLNKKLKMIKKPHINDIIIYYCKLLKDQGKLTNPRDMQTLELLNTHCILTNPKNNIVTLKDRKLSKKYLAAELEWYKSGDLNIEKIKKYSSMWSKICDENGNINSNYGYWAKYYMCSEHITQFNWCIKELYEDPNSRRAIINYNNPDHKYDGDDGDDDDDGWRW